MKRFLAVAAAAVTLGAAGLASNPAAAQQRQFINIGTASVAGLYYPAGGFVCQAVHATRQQLRHNIRCSVEATAGSVGNLRAIRSGDLDIAFSQSDWQYHAYRGTNVFQQDGANQDLRFIMSLHPDVMHLVSSRQSGIRTVEDIRGKRVNSGNVGSGTEATNYLMFRYLGIDPRQHLALDSKLTAREQASALCDNKIDAFIFPGGLGAGTIQEATNTCDVTIGNITGAGIDRMLQEHPYFARITIPANTYRGQTAAVTTFGPLATIVANTRVPDDVVYVLVKSIMDNFEAFKQQNAVFAALTREGSATAGRSVPYHPGAERYYRETGLAR
ncbi:MAG: TAXI family TRAP transporter solute-binding subunit [Alphaproteobacteria bacterium]|nr:TAXI family TRAP transporter solute-binding subunit [Alphaproteobacteria bacterium]